MTMHSKDDPSSATTENMSLGERIFGAPQRQVDKFTEASLMSQAAFIMGTVIGLFIVLLLLTVLGGITIGETRAVADTVAIIRDLFIILLAMQGMIIALSLVVLILQLASVLNLLENEISPMVQDLQKTASTVKGTSEFLSENLAAPVIESKAMFAGVSLFTRELFGIRRALKKGDSKDKAKGEKNE